MGFYMKIKTMKKITASLLLLLVVSTIYAQMLPKRLLLFQQQPSVLDGFSPTTYNLKSGFLGGAGQPESMFIGANGTKIFMAESNLCANYFNMAQWDLTNSSSYGNALCLPNPYSELEDMTWNSDGSKFYQLANSHDIVLEYSTTTNWGFTNVASTGNTLTTTVFETNPIDMFWGDSGQSLYIIDGVGQIHRYILSPAYNLSNPFYAGNTSVSSVESNTEAMWIDNTGTKMFVVGKSKKIHEFELSTAWSPGSKALIRTIDFSSIDADYFSGIWFNPSFSKMYISAPYTSGSLDYNYVYEFYK